MLNAVDKEVYKLLKVGQSPSEIYKSLKNFWTSSKKEEVLSLFYFLYLSKSFSELIDLSLKQIKTHKILHAGFLIESLIRSQVSIEKEFLENLFKVIEKQNLEETLLTSEWAKSQKIFEPRLKQIVNEANEYESEELTALQKDLEFMQVQSINELEEEAIVKLLQKDPENPKLQEDLRSLQQKRAANILKDYKASEQKAKKSLTQTDPKQAKILVEGIKKQIEQKKEDALALCVFLYLLDCPLQAEAILKNHLHSQKSLWIYAEILFASKQFILCLNFLRILEEKQKENPNALFNIYFIKAKIFFELGQKGRGIKILKSILKVRPNYKQAQSLVEKWSS